LQLKLLFNARFIKGVKHHPFPKQQYPILKHSTIACQRLYEIAFLIGLFVKESPIDEKKFHPSWVNLGHEFQNQY